MGSFSLLKKSLWLRLIAVVTLQIFCLEQVVWAASSSRSIFASKSPSHAAIRQRNLQLLEQRQQLHNGQTSSTVHSPQSTVNVPPPLTLAALEDLSVIHIPPEDGQVLEAWQPEAVRSGEFGVRNESPANSALRTPHSAFSPTVVLLQDLHTQPDAQLAEGRILSHLYKTYNVRLVAAEGAAGPVDLAFFQRYPNDQAVRESLAAAFLQLGQMKGHEYVAITHQLPVQIYGVEAASLHEENGELFKQVLDAAPAAQQVLERIQRALEALKPKLYSKSLQAFDEQISRFQAHEMDLTAYVTFLHQMADRVGLEFARLAPTLAQLEQLRDQEQTINRPQVDEEIQRLTAELAGLLQSAQHQEIRQHLEALSAQFARQAIAPAYYYAQLLDIAGRVGIERSRYPALSGVSDYLTASSRLLSYRLWPELDHVVATLTEQLAGSNDAKTLARLVRHAQLLQDLFGLRLTTDQWRYAWEHRAELTLETFRAFLEPQLTRHHLDLFVDYPAALVDAHLPLVERFYILAEQRDAALVANTLRLLDARDSSLGTRDSQTPTPRITRHEARGTGHGHAVVLVAGGFHTQGITALLRERQIPYVVISPTATGELDEARYHRLVRGQTASLEELLTEARTRYAKRNGTRRVAHRSRYDAALSSVKHPRNVLLYLAAAAFLVALFLPTDANVGAELVMRLTDAANQLPDLAQGFGAEAVEYAERLAVALQALPDQTQLVSPELFDQLLTAVQQHTESVDQLLSRLQLATSLVADATQLTDVSGTLSQLGGAQKFAVVYTATMLASNDTSSVQQKGVLLAALERVNAERNAVVTREIEALAEEGVIPARFYVSEAQATERLPQGWYNAIVTKRGTVDGEVTFEIQLLDLSGPGRILETFSTSLTDVRRSVAQQHLRLRPTDWHEFAYLFQQASAVLRSGVALDDSVKADLQRLTTQILDPFDTTTVTSKVSEHLDRLVVELQADIGVSAAESADLEAVAQLMAPKGVEQSKDTQAELMKQVREQLQAVGEGIAEGWNQPADAVEAIIREIASPSRMDLSRGSPLLYLLTSFGKDATVSVFNCVCRAVAEYARFAPQDVKGRITAAELWLYNAIIAGGVSPEMIRGESYLQSLHEVLRHLVAINQTWSIGEAQSREKMRETIQLGYAVFAQFALPDGRHHIARLLFDGVPSQVGPPVRLGFLDETEQFVELPPGERFAVVTNALPQVLPLRTMTRLELSRATGACGVVGAVFDVPRLPPAEPIQMDRYNPNKIVMEAIRGVEPRGYDSTGVLVIGFDEAGNLVTQERRTFGAGDELERILANNPFTVVPALVVLHTRWRTVGRITILNTHPQVTGGTIELFNGDIRNYDKIRAWLRGDPDHGLTTRSSGHKLSPPTVGLETLPDALLQDLPKYRETLKFFARQAGIKIEEFIEGIHEKADLEAAYDKLYQRFLKVIATHQSKVDLRIERPKGVNTDAWEFSAALNHLFIREMIKAYSAEPSALEQRVKEFWDYGMLHAMRQFDDIKVGYYGVVAVYADNPQRVYAAKVSGQPLAIGVGDRQVAVSSEAMGFPDGTKAMVSLKNGDFVVISPDIPGKYEVFAVPPERGATKNRHFPFEEFFEDGVANREPGIVVAGTTAEVPLLVPVKSALRPQIPFDKSIYKVTKTLEIGGEEIEFRTYTEKEIHEGPRGVNKTNHMDGRLGVLRGRIDGGSAPLIGLNISDEELRKVDKVILLASGTSSHAAMMSEAWLRGVARLPSVEVVDGMEILERIHNDLIHEMLRIADRKRQEAEQAGRYEEALRWEGITYEKLTEKLSLTEPSTIVQAIENWGISIPGYGDQVLVVAISQSGNTKETIDVMPVLRALGCKFHAIVNEPGMPPIPQEASDEQPDKITYHLTRTEAGPEMGVASTKATLSQIAMMGIFGTYLGLVRGTLPKKRAAEFVDALDRLPPKLEQLVNSKALKEQLRALAKEMIAHKQFAVGLGRGRGRAGEGAAREMGLKINELAYLLVNALNLSMMKHGPIALFNTKAYALIYLLDPATKGEALGNLKQIGERGGIPIIFAMEGDEEAAAAAKQHGGQVIYVPATHPDLMPIVGLIPAQFLALFIAEELEALSQQVGQIARNIYWARERANQIYDEDHPHHHRHDEAVQILDAALLEAEAAFDELLASGQLSIVNDRDKMRIKALFGKARRGDVVAAGPGIVNPEQWTHFARMRHHTTELLKLLKDEDLSTILFFEDFLWHVDSKSEHHWAGQLARSKLAESEVARIRWHFVDAKQRVKGSDDFHAFCQSCIHLISGDEKSEAIDLIKDTYGKFQHDWGLAQILHRNIDKPPGLAKKVTVQNELDLRTKELLYEMLVRMGIPEGDALDLVERGSIRFVNGKIRSPSESFARFVAAVRGIPYEDMKRLDEYHETVFEVGFDLLLKVFNTRMYLLMQDVCQQMGKKKFRSFMGAAGKEWVFARERADRAGDQSILFREVVAKYFTDVEFARYPGEFFKSALFRNSGFVKALEAAMPRSVLKEIRITDAEFDKLSGTAAERRALWRGYQDRKIVAMQERILALADRYTEVGPKERIAPPDLFIHQDQDVVIQGFEALIKEGFAERVERLEKETVGRIKREKQVLQAFYRVADVNPQIVAVVHAPDDQGGKVNPASGPANVADLQSVEEVWGRAPHRNPLFGLTADGMRRGQLPASTKMVAIVGNRAVYRETNKEGEVVRDTVFAILEGGKWRAATKAEAAMDAAGKPVATAANETDESLGQLFEGDGAGFTGYQPALQRLVDVGGQEALTLPVYLFDEVEGRKLPATGFTSADGKSKTLVTRFGPATAAATETILQAPRLFLGGRRHEAVESATNSHAAGLRAEALSYADLNLAALPGAEAKLIQDRKDVIATELAAAATIEAGATPANLVAEFGITPQLAETIAAFTDEARGLNLNDPGAVGSFMQRVVERLREFLGDLRSPKAQWALASAVGVFIAVLVFQLLGIEAGPEMLAMALPFFRRADSIWGKQVPYAVDSWSGYQISHEQTIVGSRETVWTRNAVARLLATMAKQELEVTPGKSLALWIGEDWTAGLRVKVSQQPPVQVPGGKEHGTIRLTGELSNQVTLDGHRLVASGTVAAVPRRGKLTRLAIVPLIGAAALVGLFVAAAYFGVQDADKLLGVIPAFPVTAGTFAQQLEAKGESEEAKRVRIRSSVKTLLDQVQPFELQLFGHNRPLPYVEDDLIKIELVRGWQKVTSYTGVNAPLLEVVIRAKDSRDEAIVREAIANLTLRLKEDGREFQSHIEAGAMGSSIVTSEGAIMSNVRVGLAYIGRMVGGYEVIAEEGDYVVTTSGARVHKRSLDTIAATARITGDQTRIEERVTVDAYAVIDSSVVAAGTHVGEGAVVQTATVERNVLIEPNVLVLGETMPDQPDDSLIQAWRQQEEVRQLRSRVGALLRRVVADIASGTIDRDLIGKGEKQVLARADDGMVKVWIHLSGDPDRPRIGVGVEWIRGEARVLEQALKGLEVRLEVEHRELPGKVAFTAPDYYGALHATWTKPFPGKEAWRHVRFRITDGSLAQFMEEVPEEAEIGGERVTGRIGDYYVLESGAWVHKDATVEATAEITGQQTVVDAGAYIGHASKVINSIVARDARVDRHSHVINSTVHERAVVTDGSTLRTAAKPESWEADVGGTMVAGNVSRTTVGPGAVVSGSYLTSVEVGQGSRITNSTVEHSNVGADNRWEHARVELTRTGRDVKLTGTEGRFIEVVEYWVGDEFELVGHGLYEHGVMTNDFAVFDYVGGKMKVVQIIKGLPGVLIQTEGIEESSWAGDLNVWKKHPDGFYEHADGTIWVDGLNGNESSLHTSFWTQPGAIRLGTQRPIGMPTAGRKMSNDLVERSLDPQLTHMMPFSATGYDPTGRMQGMLDAWARTLSGAARAGLSPSLVYLGWLFTFSPDTVVEVMRRGQAMLDARPDRKREMRTLTEAEYHLGMEGGALEDAWDQFPNLVLRTMIAYLKQLADMEKDRARKAGYQQASKLYQAHLDSGIWTFKDGKLVDSGWRKWRGLLTHPELRKLRARMKRRAKTVLDGAQFQRVGLLNDPSVTKHRHLFGNPKYEDHPRRGVDLSSSNLPALARRGGTVGETLRAEREGRWLTTKAEILGAFPGVEIGRYVRIHSTAVIQGGVIIGDRAEIGPHATLGDGAVIGAGAKILGGSNIHGNVGEDARIVASWIGPFASIGKGAGIESSLVEYADIAPGAELIRSNIQGVENRSEKKVTIGRTRLVDSTVRNTGRGAHATTIVDGQRGGVHLYIEDAWIGKDAKLIPKATIKNIRLDTREKIGGRSTGGRYQGFTQNLHTATSAINVTTENPTFEDFEGNLREVPNSTNIGGESYVENAKLGGAFISTETVIHNATFGDFTVTSNVVNHMVGDGEVVTDFTWKEGAGAGNETLAGVLDPKRWKMFARVFISKRWSAAVTDEQKQWVGQYLPVKIRQARKAFEEELARRRRLGDQHGLSNLEQMALTEEADRRKAAGALVKGQTLTVRYRQFEGGIGTKVIDPSNDAQWNWFLDIMRYGQHRLPSGRIELGLVVDVSLEQGVVWAITENGERVSHQPADVRRLIEAAYTGAVAVYRDAKTQETFAVGANQLAIGQDKDLARYTDEQLRAGVKRLSHFDNDEMKLRDSPYYQDATGRFVNARIRSTDNGRTFDFVWREKSINKVGVAGDQRVQRERKRRKVAAYDRDMTEGRSTSRYQAGEEALSAIIGRTGTVIVHYLNEEGKEKIEEIGVIEQDYQRLHNMVRYGAGIQKVTGIEFQQSIGTVDAEGEYEQKQLSPEEGVRFVEMVMTGGIPVLSVDFGSAASPKYLPVAFDGVLNADAETQYLASLTEAELALLEQPFTIERVDLKTLPRSVAAEVQDHEALFRVRMDIPDVGKQEYLIAIHKGYFWSGKDSTINGETPSWVGKKIALGGNRFKPYATPQEAEIDVLKLSYGMTSKALMLGFGLRPEKTRGLLGAKGVTIASKPLDEIPLQQQGLILEGFARFVDALPKVSEYAYITAEDVGVSPGFVDWMARFAPWTTVPSAKIPALPPSPFTALAIDQSVQVTVDKLVKKGQLDQVKDWLGRDSAKPYAGLTVWVQGVGNVGLPLTVDYYVAKGANVVVTDTNPKALDRLRVRMQERYERGVGTETSLGQINNLLDQINEGRQDVEGQDVEGQVWILDDPKQGYDLHVKIYSPMALGQTVTLEHVERMHRAGVVGIVGSANNQLPQIPAEQDKVAKKLEAYEMLYAPDWVVNAGGLGGVGAKIFGLTEEQVLSVIPKNLQEVFDYAEKYGISTAVAARQMAAKMLAEALAESDRQERRYVDRPDFGKRIQIGDKISLTITDARHTAPGQVQATDDGRNPDGRFQIRVETAAKAPYTVTSASGGGGTYDEARRAWSAAPGDSLTFTRDGEEIRVDVKFLNGRLELIVEQVLGPDVEVTTQHMPLKEFLDFEEVEIINPGSVAWLQNLKTGDWIGLGLAAGYASRFNQNQELKLSKVRATMAGQPIGSYTIGASLNLGVKHFVTIVGYQAEEVMDMFTSAAKPFGQVMTFIRDRKWNGGTAYTPYHAFAIQELRNSEAMAFVTATDQPLFDEAVVMALRQKAEQSPDALTIAYAEVEDPKRMGRVVVDKKDPEKILAIVEFKVIEAMQPGEELYGYTKEELLNYKKVNVSLYGLKAKTLYQLQSEINNDNPQGEFLGTDIIELAGERGIERIGVAIPGWKAPDISWRREVPEYEPRREFLNAWKPIITWEEWKERRLVLDQADMQAMPEMIRKRWGGKGAAFRGQIGLSDGRIIPVFVFTALAGDGAVDTDRMVSRVHLEGYPTDLEALTAALDAVGDPQVIVNVDPDSLDETLHGELTQGIRAMVSTVGSRYRIGYLSDVIGAAPAETGSTQMVDSFQGPVPWAPIEAEIGSLQERMNRGETAGDGLPLIQPWPGTPNVFLVGELDQRTLAGGVPGVIAPDGTIYIARGADDLLWVLYHEGVGRLEARILQAQAAAEAALAEATHAASLEAEAMLKQGVDLPTSTASLKTVTAADLMVPTEGMLGGVRYDNRPGETIKIQQLQEMPIIAQTRRTSFQTNVSPNGVNEQESAAATSSTAANTIGVFMAGEGLEAGAAVPGVLFVVHPVIAQSQDLAVQEWLGRQDHIVHDKGNLPWTLARIHQAFAQDRLVFFIGPFDEELRLELGWTESEFEALLIASTFNGALRLEDLFAQIRGKFTPEALRTARDILAAK